MLGNPPYLRQVQASNPRRLSQAPTHDDYDDDDDNDDLKRVLLATAGPSWVEELAQV